MKIKEIMPNISPSTFIEDYCKLKGIDDIDAYLQPSWDNFEDCNNYDNMQEGFELFDKHILTDSVIVIVSDADVDGMLSSTLEYNYIKATAPNQTVIVLFHDSKKHGINYKEMMDKIISAKPNLLILPDAGTNDAKEIKQLISMGIDVLVLDHHDKDEDTLLDYDKTKAVVINNQISSNVINKGASGTVVTWKFCMYCDMQYGTIEAINYLDLCAFSLIADICDCSTLENRAILEYGFSHINNMLLQALCLEFAKDKPITPNVVGWNVNPKLNGVMRNDCTQDHIDIFTAFINPSATTIWKKGVRGKEQEWNIVDKVVAQAKLKEDKETQDADIAQFLDIIIPTINEQDNVLMIIDKYDLSHTLTGLVASKISALYNKPCMVIRQFGDEYKGSVRSPIPFKTTLIDSGLFEFNLGHEGAFGTCFKSKKMSNIKQWLDTLEIDDSTKVLKSYKYSSIPSDLFSSVVEYDSLYCKGFEKPLFHIKPFTITNHEVQKMGNATLKIVKDGMTLIRFFTSGKQFDEFFFNEDREIKLEVEFIVSLNVNEWNGNCYNQLFIEDYSVKEKFKKIEELNIDDIF